MTIIKSMKTATALSALAICALPISAPMSAHAQDISVSAGVDGVTEYVFRGVSLADSAIQPYIEASTGNLTFGAWFSKATGTASDAAGDELDLYASYSFALSDTASLDAGITYYHYPSGGSLFETDNGGAGTYELSLSASFDAPLSPSVTAYYDLTLEALTLEAGIEHSVPLGGPASFDVGASAGFVDAQGGDYQYGNASASVGYALSDKASAYIGGNLALSSEDSLDYKKLQTARGKGSMVWFGAGISTDF